MKKKLIILSSIMLAFGYSAQAQCDGAACNEVFAVVGSNSNTLESAPFQVTATNLGGNVNGSIWTYSFSSPVNLKYKIGGTAHVVYYNSLPENTSMQVDITETCVCRDGTYRHLRWNVVR